MGEEVDWIKKLGIMLPLQWSGGTFFIGFKSCVEGHMGGATKIVEPICGASKGVFKGVARFEESPKKENFIEYDGY